MRNKIASYRVPRDIQQSVQKFRQMATGNSQTNVKFQVIQTYQNSGMVNNNNPYLSQNPEGTLRRAQSVVRPILPAWMGNSLFSNNDNRQQRMSNYTNIQRELLGRSHDNHIKATQAESNSEIITKVSQAEFSHFPRSAFSEEEMKHIIESLRTSFKSIVGDDNNYIFSCTLPLVKAINLPQGSKLHSHNLNLVFGNSINFTPNELKGQSLGSQVLIQAKVNESSIDRSFYNEGEELPKAVIPYNQLVFPMVTNSGQLIMMAIEICLDHNKKVGLDKLKDSLETLFKNDPQGFIQFLENPLLYHEVMSASIPIGYQLTGWTVHTDPNTDFDDEKPEENYQCEIVGANIDRTVTTVTSNGSSINYIENKPIPAPSLSNDTIQVVDKIVDDIQNNKLVEHGNTYTQSTGEAPQIEDEDDSTYRP